MKSSGDNEIDELLWAYIEKTKARTATTPIHAPAPDKVAGNGASHPEMKELYRTADAVHATLGADVNANGAALARARLERLIMEEPIPRGGLKRLRGYTPRQVATFSLLVLLLTALAALAYNAYQSRTVDTCAVTMSAVPSAKPAAPLKPTGSRQPQLKSRQPRSAN